MNKCTLVCAITALTIVSASVDEGKGEEEKEEDGEERTDGKGKKRASRTISGNGMETTHQTREQDEGNSSPTKTV